MSDKMRHCIMSFAAGCVFPALHWIAGYPLFARSPDTAWAVGIGLVCAAGAYAVIAVHSGGEAAKC